MQDLRKGLEKHQLFLKGLAGGVQLKLAGETVANFDFREFSLAKVVFTDSQFQGCLFSGCDFTGAIVSNCSFNACDFRTAILRNLIFSFRELKGGCSFEGATMGSLVIAYTPPSGTAQASSNAILTKLNIIGDLSLSSFYQTSLQMSWSKLDGNLVFEKCLINRLDFSNRDFGSRKLTFHDCDLSFSNFSGIKLLAGKLEDGLCVTGNSNLQMARFEGALIPFCKFEGKVNASMTKFAGADLHESSLLSVDFTSADFRGAIMYAARLNSSRLTNAQFDETTNRNNVDYSDCLWIDGIKTCAAGSIGLCR